MKLIDQLRAAVAAPRGHLLAHFQSSGYKGVDQLATSLRPYLRQVNAFRLSDEVVEAACTLALDHPDILSELSRRCRLPYDICFFEWSNWHKLRVCNGVIQDACPPTVGALLMREPDSASFSVTTVSPGAPDGGIGMAAFTWVFSPDNDWGGHGSPVTALLQRSLDDDVALYLRRLDWSGSGLEKAVPDSVLESFYQHRLMVPYIYGGFTWQGKELSEAQLQWDSARSLSRRVKLDLNRFEKRGLLEALESDKLVEHRVPPWRYKQFGKPAGHHAGLPFYRSKIKDLVRQDICTSFAEEFGDPKLIIAALALINANDRIVEIGEPVADIGSTFAGGRILKYMAQRTVHLKLPFKQCRRMLRALAYKIRRRRHEVMGHWCSSHRDGDTTCAHQYDDIDPVRKMCKLCKHRIWYRKEHARGDASIGFVRHEYEVERRA